MSIKDIIGNQQAKETMLSIIRTGKLGAAYIFSGEENTGKSFAAVQFSKALNCRALLKDGDCCDRCENCLTIEKVILNLDENFNTQNPHPDILYIDTEKAKLSIELVRDALKSANAIKTVYLRKKIVIIKDAERMTIDASNSILKELEEPKSDVVIILICNNIESILPTIISRCYNIAIKRASINEIKEKILIIKPGIDEKLAEKMAIYSEGKIGLALNYDKVKKNYEEVVEIFKILNLKTDNVELIFNKIEELELKYKSEKAEKVSGATRNFLIENLKMLAYIYKDLLHAITGVDNYFENKYPFKLDEYKEFTPEKILKILFLIKNAYYDLEANANVGLLLNSLFFNIRKVVRTE